MSGGGDGAVGGAGVWARSAVYTVVLSLATWGVIGASNGLHSEVDGAAPAHEVAMPSEGFEQGERLFRRYCVSCHGVTGDAEGELSNGESMRPRSFRRESFRFPTTESGISCREDLLRVIRDGIPSAGMPPTLLCSAEERELLVDYVIEICRLAGRDTEAGPPLEVVLPADGFVADAEAGNAVFQKLCAVCHGANGSGESAIPLADELGRAITPRDLRAGIFRGGGADEDLYRRVRLGIPGTAMGRFTPEIVSDEEVWHLIAHIRSLSD